MSGRLPDGGCPYCGRIGCVCELTPGLPGLAKHWRRLPTAQLEAWADANPDHRGVDEVLLELDERDHQADANRGAMNGWAPQ